MSSKLFFKSAAIILFATAPSCKRNNQSDTTSNVVNADVPPLSSVAYAELYDNTFATKTYSENAKGPFHFDDATSIAKLFHTHGMIKGDRGNAVKFESYDARNMDNDSLNFERLDSNRNLDVGDVIVISPQHSPCSSRKSLRFAVVSAVTAEGKRQNSWKSGNTFLMLRDRQNHYQKIVAPDFMENYNLCVGLRNKHFQ